MTPVYPAEGHQNGASAIDPISRQILQRTMNQQKLQPGLPGTPVPSPSALTEDVPDGSVAESDSLRRTDTALSRKPSQTKKKGGSFLSRIMGGKKREDSVDVPDNASEIYEERSGGTDAEVFSQPVGYIPKFPAPPRYIRVKAQNRKKRDLDRLFLAQILLDPEKARKGSNEVDAKIIGIEDKPQVPLPNSSRKSNNPIWASGFSKDGRYFAAAGQDKKLRVWEVISTKDTKEAEDEQADGGEHANKVKLNAPVFKQKLIREYDGHTAAILDLSWSKNNFLLSSSMDKTVRLYHVSRDDCLCAFKHHDFVTSIQFHPRDDRFFLAGSLDAKLRLWSIPDKSVAYWAQVPDMITAVAFTPDGKTAIAGCLSGLCILYTTEGLKAHSQIHVRSTRGRNTKGSKITGIDTVSLPQENGQADTKLLITSNDSRIRMYNLRDRALEIKFRGNENSCSQIRASFSDDGQFVICGSEDRKVYVWPTGQVERQDSDKRPMEVFEAHSQIVTAAVFAPASSRRLLTQSGDPIYDICNPPPVVLLSRTDSILSSPAPTSQGGHSDDQHANVVSRSNSPPRPVESPAYQARSLHLGGHIIVTADYSGQIKVFRQDCAYQKRRDSNWETGSTLSRKVLGRTASIATRASAASSTRRSSLNLPAKSTSTDRILNWRNSIASTNSQSASISDFSMRRANTVRERSSSPRKSLSNRLSLRYGSTPLAQTTSPPSPDKSQHSTSRPRSVIISPAPADELQLPEERSPEQPPPSRSPPKPSRPQYHFRNSTQLSPVGEDTVTGTDTSQMLDNIVDTDENPLFLLEGHSYMAWDTHNMTSLANQVPRTPGLSASSQLTAGRNPISRAASSASRLSSEMTASSASANGDDHDSRSLSLNGSGNARHNSAIPRQRQFSAGTAGENTDEEELKCKSCGGEQFKMVKTSGGGKRLRCTGCKTVMV